MTPFVCHAAASGSHPATTGSGARDAAGRASADQALEAVGLRETSAEEWTNVSEPSTRSSGILGAAMVDHAALVAESELRGIQAKVAE